MAQPVLMQTMTVSLSENSQTALLLLNSECRLLAINSAAEELLAHSRRQLLGTSLSQWFGDTSPLHELIARAWREQRCIQITELALHLPLRGEHWRHVAITPQSDGILLELFPADDNHRLARDAEQSQRSREWHNVLSNLAHEIKNPLSGVRAAAQLLSRELQDPAQREYTDLIQREADRLRALVERLLAPARQQALHAHNIHQILDNVISIATLAHKNSAPTVQLQRDFDPGLPDVPCIPDAMTQVLLNLLNNAFEAAPENSVIQVRTRAESGVPVAGKRVRLALRIDICDSGAGLPEHLHSRLFLPVQSGKKNGTGIGLSIAQTLMQQQQGLIEYDRHPDCTRFTVWLPLETRSP